MAITGLRMTTSFCVSGRNYRDTSVSALIGLYKAGCKLGEVIRGVVYENDDYGDIFSLPLPFRDSLSFPLLSSEAMQKRITTLCQDLPPNTLLSTRVFASFPSGEESISVSVRPTDGLSHTFVLGGNYDTLVEMCPAAMAEQNMRAYARLGKYVQEEIKPIYGIQDPYMPSTGLEELIATHASPPLDWVFYGHVLTDQLRLRTSSCLASAKIVDWLSDGGVFFAFADWMDLATNPDLSPLTKELREQIRMYCDWSQIVQASTHKME